MTRQSWVVDDLKTAAMFEALGSRYLARWYLHSALSSLRWRHLARIAYATAAALVVVYLLTRPETRS